MFDRLSAPFPPSRISWRVGNSNKKKEQARTNDKFAKATKGQALAYLDARDVMERLDEVCGPAGWQCRYPHADGKTVCEIGIKVDDEWVWKADGAGDTDFEAEKGALSAAFKRAAVRWGIGRYLYDVTAPWVDLDDREQIPAAEHRKLEALLTRSAPVAQRESADVLAVNLLRGCSSDQALFKEAWEKNKAGWKQSMTPAEYNRVVAEMQRIAADFQKVAA